MIKVFLLNFIRQMDFFQVMILIRNYVKKLDLKALKIETQVTEFDTRLNALDESLKESRKTGKTKKLRELDELRDEMVQGLYGHVKSQVNYPTPEVALAAQDLWLIFEGLGTKIYDLPDREESGKLVTLLGKLNEPKNITKLQTTTGLPWKERLEDYNKQFVDLYSDRTAVEANYEVGRVKADRAKTQAAFTDLCEQINALGRVNGMAPYKELIDFINRAVDVARITADQRSTVAKNNANKANDTAAQK